MDPNTTLEQLVEALETADHSEAIQPYLDLAEWLEKDGFEPDEWSGGHLRILMLCVKHWLHEAGYTEVAP